MVRDLRECNGVSRGEKYVSLKTTSKVTARERIAEVKKVQDDIKQEKL